MDGFPRYALYFVPSSDDALYRFGATLLGYDAFSGKEIDFPAAAVSSFSDWATLTAEPRKYGFHATLKAPIALMAGATESDLVAAFERFVQARRPIPQITPVVRAIGRFVAIVPDIAPLELATLADDCVRTFDALRAPLSDSDRQRRLKSPLTPRQIAHLGQWGYPYVFEEFRFHMTLTGSLSSDRIDAVLDFLQQRFAALECATLQIGHLAILRQDTSDSRFVVLHHTPLVPN